MGRLQFHVLRVTSIPAETAWLIGNLFGFLGLPGSQGKGQHSIGPGCYFTLWPRLPPREGA